MKRASILLLLFTLGPALLAASDSLRGPIPLRHIHPLLLPFHTAEAAWLPRKDAPPVWIEHSYTAGNTYMLDLGYVDENFVAIVDTETYLFATTLTLRPLPAVTTRIALNHVALAGGISDPLIEAHHEFFGLPNGGREHRPKYQSTLYMQNGDTVWVDHDGRAAALARVTVDTRVRAVTFNGPGAAVALGTEAAISLPTSDSSLVTGSGSVDTEVTAIAQLENVPWEIYGNLGWIRYGTPQVSRAMPLARHALRYGVTWIWAPWEVLAIQVQILGQSSPLDVDHPRLGGHMSIAGFGASFHPTPWLSMYGAFVEEFFTYAAVDVALHVGARVEIPARTSPGTPRESEGNRR